MNQYVITYFGGEHPASPEEGKKHFARYQQWITSLGDSVIKPMAPFIKSHTIKPDGTVSEGSSVSMTGHTIIQTDSIDEAVAMTKSCPFLEINGTLEVAELVHM